jgi:hypothetical protein
MNLLKKTPLLLLALGLQYCNSTKKLERNMNAIDHFRKVITGDFDNSKQVAEEVKAGKQIHPSARHVNRIIDSRIKNIPQGPAGIRHFYVLEESYYEYPGNPVEIKPYIFKFSDAGPNKVRLDVYQVPERIDKKELRNDNEEWELDYNELKLSPTFKGAFYDMKDGCFYTNTPNDLGNGMKFTLIEKLCKDQLSVMELLEKNGQRVTPYDTPIIYDRK